MKRDQLKYRRLSIQLTPALLLISSIRSPPPGTSLCQWLVTVRNASTCDVDYSVRAPTAFSSQGFLSKGCRFVRAFHQGSSMHLTLCDYSPPGSSVHGDSPGRNIGAGCHSLFQGIFPIQGLDPGLSHCRRFLYCLSHQGSLSKNLTVRLFIIHFFTPWLAKRNCFHSS